MALIFHTAQVLEEATPYSRNSLTLILGGFTPRKTSRYVHAPSAKATSCLEEGS